MKQATMHSRATSKARKESQAQKDAIYGAACANIRHRDWLERLFMRKGAKA